MSNDLLTKRFIKAMIGKYSNFDQSQANPKRFAHINMFFRDVPFSIFNEKVIYSEQSYDHDPWNPYRQALHKIYADHNLITIENYTVEDPIRIAGSGFMPELLNTLKDRKLKKRDGCSMIFEELTKGHFVGRIKTPKGCIVSHSGRKTYVFSKVEFSNYCWNVHDEGFDCDTGKKIWGSEHGPIQFKKVFDF